MIELSCEQIDQIIKGKKVHYKDDLIETVIQLKVIDHEDECRHCFYRHSVVPCCFCIAGCEYYEG